MVLLALLLLAFGQSFQHRHFCEGRIAFYHFSILQVPFALVLVRMTSDDAADLHRLALLVQLLW